MNKIIILNFEDASVHIFDYDNQAYDDALDFFEVINEEEGYNFKEQNCEWMIVKDLKIEIH
jgi:hypothetical protein